MSRSCNGSFPCVLYWYKTALSMKRDIYIISGVMASGKDSVLKVLGTLTDISVVVATTTRSMRPKEKEGFPYHFTDPETFKREIERDTFLEWSEHYGAYYGVTRQEAAKAFASGNPVFFRVNERGVHTYKKLFPDAVTIFIAPPSMGTIRERIKNRDLSLDLIRNRLGAARRQIKSLFHSGYDYVLVNQSKEDTARQILSILRSETPAIRRS